MIEPEMAFADLEDDMKLAEDFFRFLCREVLLKGGKELAFLESQYKKSRLMIWGDWRIQPLPVCHIPML